MLITILPSFYERRLPQILQACARSRFGASPVSQRGVARTVTVLTAALAGTYVALISYDGKGDRGPYRPALSPGRSLVS